MAQEKSTERSTMSVGSPSTQGIQKAHVGHVLGPFDEMDRLFDRMLSPNWMLPMRMGMGMPGFAERLMPFEGKAPRVDIIDRETEVVLRVEAPGVNKDDLEVSLNDNTVTIRGTTKRDETEEKGEYCRREISYGEFSRTVALPADVDREKAKAKFKDGVLELILPKVEAAKRSTIKIETE